MEKLINLLFGPDRVTNPSALGDLITSTYTLGIVVAFLMVVIAAIISNSIDKQPGQSDVTKRKRWFWALSSVAPVVLSLYNFLFVIEQLKGKLSFMSQFQSAAGISAVVMVITYILLGVVVSFIFRKGKLGDWFFSSRSHKQ